MSFLYEALLALLNANVSAKPFGNPTWVLAGSQFKLCNTSILVLPFKEEFPCKKKAKETIQNINRFITQHVVKPLCGALFSYFPLIFALAMNFDWILHDNIDNAIDHGLLKFPAGVSEVESRVKVIS